MLTIIKSGSIKGQEFNGQIMTHGTQYIASIVEIGGNGFAEHYTQTFSAFEAAETYIHETWSELEKVK